MKRSLAVCQALLCGLLCGLTGSVLHAEPLSPSESAGKRLYREGLSASGEALMARVGAADILLPASAVPCANCHGADGRGLREGGVRPPDITWPRLSGPYGQRQINGRDYPAYDDAALARAVQEGRDPAHNRLDLAMPRFVLSMADQRNLGAYLKRLADERDPGLQPERLLLGSLLPSSGPLAEEGATLAAVLRGSLERINQAGGIHGRQLQLVVLDPGPDAASARLALAQLIEQQQVFALLAPLAPALDGEWPALLEQAAVPLIGAPSWLGPSPQSRQIFQPLSGLYEQLVALADYAGDGLQARPGPTLVSYPAGSEQGPLAQLLSEYLQRQGWQDVRLQAFNSAQTTLLQDQASDLRSVFYLGPGEGFGQLAKALHQAGGEPWLFAASSQVAGDIFQLPASFSRRLFLAYPFVPGDWTPAGRAALTQLRRSQGLDGRHAVLQVSAYSAVLLFSEAMKQVGRDASREKLIRALEGLHDIDTGLTPRLSFGPGRRQGLSGAHIVTVDLPELHFYPVATYKQLPVAP